MGRKNCNAQRIYKPAADPEGPLARRDESWNKLERTKLNTTGESIVREFRRRPERASDPEGIANRGVRVEIPLSKEPISIFERAVRIFLILAAGWLFGYFHCWMALK